MADSNNQTQHSTHSPLRFLLRVPVPWVFILSYLAGAGLEVAFPSHLNKEALRGVYYAGLIVFAAGAMLAGWGWMLFQRARTTTVPGRTSAKLVTSGPYRFTRNPMYLGLTLAYVGEAGILRQGWPLAILPFTVVYVNSIVIPLEEARLREVFREEYESYRQKVRRWI